MTAAGRPRPAERARAWAVAATEERPRALLVASLVLLGAGLMYLSCNHYFFADDWDYLLTRGTVPGKSLGWFAPHGDHWSTALVAINRLLFAVFGLRTYLPWALVVVALHLAVCFGLFTLLRRVGAAPWVALVSAWLLAFFGWGAEAYLWDAAMNLTGSLLFAVLALLVVVRDEGAVSGWRWFRLPWILLVVGLTFSGGGLPGVLFVSAFVALDRGRRAGLLTAAVPAAVFVLWYLGWGRNGNGSLLDPATLYYRVPRYVGRGLSDALDNLTVLSGIGGALALLLVALPFLRAAAGDRLRMLAIAGVAAAVGQLVLAGATRIQLGFDYAGSGRYAYLTIAYLLPAIAIGIGLVASRVQAPRWVVLATVGFLLVVCAADGIDRDITYAGGAAAVRGPWEDRVLGTVEAVDDGEQILSTSTGDELNSRLKPGLIVSPQIRAALPDRPASPQGRLEAEAMFMVGVDKDLHGLFAPAEMRMADGFADSGQVVPPGCSTHDSYPGALLRLPVGEGNEVSITGPSATIETSLQRDGRGTEFRRWSVKPGTTVFIASSAKDATLLIKVGDGGSQLLCTDG